MAALAFDNAGLGACHALAHALGGRFHVAHGRLCAMLLPHVIAHHAAADPHPYAALAAACGLPGVRGLTGAIVRLRARLGLPASLPEAGSRARPYWRLKRTCSRPRWKTPARRRPRLL